MTSEQLSNLSPEELSKLSDQELAAELLPIIPLVRAPYSGKDESDTSAKMLMPGGQRTTLKKMNKENAMIAQLLRQAGVNVPGL